VSVERFLGMVVMAFAIEVVYWIFVTDSKQLRIRCELNQFTRAQGQETELHLLLDTEERARLSRGLAATPFIGWLEERLKNAVTNVAMFRVT
jgi:hypothetical protein